MGDHSRIVVVPGASAGVGRAVACEFACRGAWLGLLARDPVRPQGTPATAALDATVRHWRRWIQKTGGNGRSRDAVERSARTLKLLTFTPTGVMVAAPATSLPVEACCHSRNPDGSLPVVFTAAKDRVPAEVELRHLCE